MHESVYGLFAGRESSREQADQAMADLINLSSGLDDEIRNLQSQLGRDFSPFEKNSTTIRQSVEAR
jgi:hypothetical protein